jgi:hypothetical protein
MTKSPLCAWRTERSLRYGRYGLRSIVLPKKRSGTTRSYAASSRYLVKVGFELDLTGFEALEIDMALSIDAPIANVVEEEALGDFEPTGRPAVAQPDDVFVLGDTRSVAATPAARTLTCRVLIQRYCLTKQQCFTEGDVREIRKLNIRPHRPKLSRCGGPSR